MADKLVTSSVRNDISEMDGMWGPYWSDKDTGVIVLVDTGADISFVRTIDGGENWNQTELFAGVVNHVAVVYDKEVPGDSGTLVHIALLDRTGTDYCYYLTVKA